ncbi:Relaxin receptor 1 Leucine-rich repeat-containing [Larimichthys crocea]|uniref:Relaxin receptor 1 Leucine-rich repeat-containing n=1 Tax=Larimichthys crocea TaxID=215358 RepID=A0A6G0I7G2_LARCR|nr:Relaxin receptor 1 Leucine-rich repeat-containing [Larimichthys crocea]
MSAGTHPSLRMDVPIIILLIHLTHTEIRGLLFSRAETETGCSLGHFPCGNMTECLPQALQCNGHKDCPNGADERRCGDNVGWADLFGETLQNSNTVDQYFLNECCRRVTPEPPGYQRIYIWLTDRAWSSPNRFANVIASRNAVFADSHLAFASAMGSNGGRHTDLKTNVKRALQ